MFTNQIQVQRAYLTPCEIQSVVIVSFTSWVVVLVVMISVVVVVVAVLVAAIVVLIVAIAVAVVIVMGMVLVVVVVVVVRGLVCAGGVIDTFVEMLTVEV